MMKYLLVFMFVLASVHGINKCGDYKTDKHCPFHCHWIVNKENPKGTCGTCDDCIDQTECLEHNCNWDFMNRTCGRDCRSYYDPQNPSECKKGAPSYCEGYASAGGVCLQKCETRDLKVCGSYAPSVWNPCKVKSEKCVRSCFSFTKEQDCKSAANLHCEWKSPLNTSDDHHACMNTNFCKDYENERICNHFTDHGYYSKYVKCQWTDGSCKERRQLLVYGKPQKAPEIETQKEKIICACVVIVIFIAAVIYFKSRSQIHDTAEGADDIFNSL